MSGYEARNYAQGDGLYTEQIQAGGTITQYQLVYVDATGRWQEADADAVATMPVLGLATQPITTGQKGRVLLQGFANYNAWTWTPGGLLYADTVTGDLTQTAPVGAGDVVQEIGLAFSATLIYFDGAGLGATGVGGGATILPGATAYVGSEATLSGYVNYFYTGDYATHTLLLAAAVDYVGTLGGGSISLEAMTFTGILVVDEDDVEVYGQGWDTIINGGVEGHAISVTGTNCVLRDLQCGTTAGGGQAYDGINSTGSYLLIDNVFVNGSDDDGINLGSASNRVVHCYIYNTDGEGIVTTAAGDGAVISNNLISTTGGDGLAINASSENCVVEGNYITGWNGEAIDDDSLTSSIGNDNWAGAGSYEVQTGVIAEPTVTAGGAWEGRVIQVENSDEARYFTWVYKNAGWRAVEVL